MARSVRLGMEGGVAVAGADWLGPASRICRRLLARPTDRRQSGVSEDCVQTRQRRRFETACSVDASSESSPVVVLRTVGDRALAYSTPVATCCGACRRVGVSCLCCKDAPHKERCQRQELLWDEPKIATQQFLGSVTPPNPVPIWGLQHCTADDSTPCPQLHLPPFSLTSPPQPALLVVLICPVAPGAASLKSRVSN